MNRHEPWDVAELRDLTEKEIYAMTILDGRGPWTIEVGDYRIDVAVRDGLVSAAIHHADTGALRISIAWATKAQAESDLARIIARIERGDL